MSTAYELHHRAKRGETDEVRRLLADGAKVSARDRANYTALMHAVESPKATVELVRTLLDHGRGRTRGG